MLPRFIARQLSHPKGVLGRFVARLMNRHNSAMNAFVVRQLEMGPTDRVLDVGFGGGVALPLLLANAAYVAGVDPSPAMVEGASKKFADAIKAGRAGFQQASVDALPFGTATFGKACTVNTVYFWASLGVGFAELHRVLLPGGRLVVGFFPKEWMDRMGYPGDIFTSRTPDEIIGALVDAGFRDVRAQRSDTTTQWNVVVAHR
jgi:arsenite methyltransferase